MRLLHTADWHLGRRLKGIDRTVEIRYALDELLRQAKILEVDAVLIAGDVFDTPSPPAEAEKVAYHFFCQLRAAKIPAVVIAGNHDSAHRIEGVSQLLSHVGVQALGKPCKADKGGVIHLETPGGKLCVGAVPFASERRLVRSETLWDKKELEQRQHYQQVLAYLLENLAHNFRDDSVNVIMAHFMVEGAKRAFSEVDYYTRGAYSLAIQLFPAQAHYVALGHVHHPQHIPHAAPTYYAGSLIQVDFGEEQEAKGFHLVTVEPARPAHVEFVPIPCQRPLKVIRCHEHSLQETLEAYRQYPGLLKVVVDLEMPKVGLANKIRKICPQALIIEPCYPHVHAVPQSLERAPADAITEFHRYWRKRMNTTPPSAVLHAFEQLYHELNHETH